MGARGPEPDAGRAYFFDVDGTLLRLAATPGAVKVDRRLRRVLERVYRATGGAVALISGRRLADLDVLFPHVRFPAAGQHGLERRSPQGRVTVHARATAALLRARRRLGRIAAQHPGLMLEDKGLSLALHYRRAPRLAGYAHRLARAETARLGRGYRVLAGNRVAEIGPAHRDKGGTVRAFLREAPFRHRVPVFLGDDVSDEDAFRVVNQLGGMSIKVGRGATRARWRLPDVAAVLDWLEHGRPAPRPVR